MSSIQRNVAPTRTLAEPKEAENSWRRLQQLEVQAQGTWDLIPTGNITPACVHEIGAETFEILHVSCPTCSTQVLLPICTVEQASPSVPLAMCATGDKRVAIGDPFTSGEHCWDSLWNRGKQFLSSQHLLHTMCAEKLPGLRNLSPPSSHPVPIMAPSVKPNLDFVHPGGAVVTLRTESTTSPLMPITTRKLTMGYSISPLLFHSLTSNGTLCDWPPDTTVCSSLAHSVNPPRYGCCYPRTCTRVLHKVAKSIGNS